MVARIHRLLAKQATGPLSGELVVPSSKYHAHRALILASLAPGVSRILGLSDAGHVRHTVAALRSLGTKIRVEGDTFVVEGGPYRPSSPVVSVGSSGSTLYFLTGLMSLAESPVTIVGQRYFQRRPIGPLLEALSGLGVRLSSSSGCPPISVEPHRPRGGRVSIPGTLSQWISGLLLLAPFASNACTISIEGPLNESSYIDLTIKMMAELGLEVQVSQDGRRFEVEPGQVPRPATIRLPPDVGAAAFGLAVTALHPSDVLFRGLPATPASQIDHPEAELIDIVAGMGLPMRADPETGLLRVRHEGIDLQPADVDCRRVPDGLPVLSVLGTFARGTTTLGHVAHVRLKESDRVSAMLQLNRMGGRVELQGDRLVCHGVPVLHGEDLSSFNDHRVLMSLAVAATRAEGETRLTYPNAYRISYPRFLDEMAAIGLSMGVETKQATARSAERPLAGSRPAREVRGHPTSSAPSPSTAASRRIGDRVRDLARLRPEELAVIEVGSDPAGAADRSLGWPELDHLGDQAAQLLLDLGVRPGEAVAYQLPNWVELVALSVGVLRIGAVCCPLMPMFRGREMAFALGASRASVLFVPERYRGRDYPVETAGLLSDAPVRTGADEPAVGHVVVVAGAGGRALAAGEPPGGPEWLCWHSWDQAVGARTPDREAIAARAPSPDALAQLLFTSGTSGEPKGALHRMATLSRAAAAQARHLGLHEADRIYIPSPLAHQTGFLYGMWLSWVLGATQILQPTWDGRGALRAVRRLGATFVQAATPFLADLLAAAEEANERPESLRIFVATGAAVPRSLADRATRSLGTTICGAWGTTETCLGSLSAPGDDPAKTGGTDGRALEGVELRVTDDQGNLLAAGQEGNLEVSSSYLFEGYLDHPEWTAEAFTPDGWYRSGDLAVIDEAGYLRIMGRVKDVINRGGEKVPVAEIEQLLHEHPAISEAAIVAMPDERLGERACAFVVTAPATAGAGGAPAAGGAERGGTRSARSSWGASDAGVQTLELAEIRRFLDARQVAKQYWPEALVVLDELPRNPAGKVQKFVLRERARELVEKRQGERG